VPAFIIVEECRVLEKEGYMDLRSPNVRREWASGMIFVQGSLAVEVKLAGRRAVTRDYAEGARM
jgi:hypothetical protein